MRLTPRISRFIGLRNPLRTPLSSQRYDTFSSHSGQVAMNICIQLRPSKATGQFVWDVSPATRLLPLFLLPFAYLSQWGMTYASTLGYFKKICEKLAIIWCIRYIRVISSEESFKSVRIHLRSRISHLSCRMSFEKERMLEYRVLFFFLLFFIFFSLLLSTSDECRAINSRKIMNRRANRGFDVQGTFTL